MVKLQYPSVFDYDVSVRPIHIISSTKNEEYQQDNSRLTSAANVAVLSRRAASDIVCPRSDSLVVAD